MKLMHLAYKLPGAFQARGNKWRRQDPFLGEPDNWDGSGSRAFTLGIIKEFWHLHWPLVAACRELDVSYRILDISGPDWFSVLKDSQCDAFIARPSVQYKPWKEMYDERLRVFGENDERIVLPEIPAIWIWESKRRTHYWLESKCIPHPKTWVFYERELALNFCESCDLPVVFKSDSGSGASGVRIFRERGALTKHIRRCFSRGFTTYRRAREDREYGSVVLQEYLPSAREWRTARIGEWFFAYEKVMGKGFHSGSGEFKYGRPPDEILNLAKRVTDLSGFKCINVDIFIGTDGELYVNELQAFWGQAGSREICRIDDQPGRMVLDEAANEWKFEEGEFCQNFMSNLRVQYLIDLLEGGTGEQDAV